MRRVSSFIFWVEHNQDEAFSQSPHSETALFQVGRIPVVGKPNARGQKMHPGYRGSQNVGSRELDVGVALQAKPAT